MKKTALVVLALASAVAFSACAKKAPPAPPPPPPPLVPEAPPPAPPPPPRAEVARVVDEYARIKAMSAEEIEKSGLLAEVLLRLRQGRDPRAGPRRPGEGRRGAEAVRLPPGHGGGALRRAGRGRLQPRPRRPAGEGRLATTWCPSASPRTA